MKYYSEITKKMYDTHEELDKAEEEYKKELISKAKEEEEQKEKNTPRQSWRATVPSQN